MDNPVPPSSRTGPPVKQNKSTRETVLPKRILVIACDDMIGMSRLPFVLSQAGCTVDLFSPPKTLISKTRYIDKHIISHSRVAPLVDQLEDYLKKSREQYGLVILGDETLLEEIATRLPNKQLETILPVEPNVLASVTSNATFAQAADSSGLPIPKYKICSNLTQLQHAAENIGFPLILRQATSSAGQGISLVYTIDQLMDVFEALENQNQLTVQEYIEGKVGSTNVLYNHGTPICWMSCYSAATLPEGIGMSCIRQPMEHPDIEPIVEKTGQLLNFHGFCGIDWIHVEDTNKLYLIEFNPRPAPGYHFGPQVNVNFSHGLQSLLDRKTPTQRPVSPFNRSLFYMFPQDVFHLIANRNYLKLFCWLPGMERAKDLPLGDPRLLMAYTGLILQFSLDELAALFSRVRRRTLAENVKKVSGLLLKKE